MDVKNCSEYYTQFCKKWRNNDKVSSILLNNRLDLKKEPFAYYVVIYTILYNNTTIDDIKVIKQNLDNEYINEVCIIRNNPSNSEFEITHEKLRLVNFFKWQGIVFTDIAALFNPNHLNIFCFNNIFFAKDSLFYLKFINRGDLCLLSSTKLKPDYINNYSHIDSFADDEDINKKHAYEFDALIKVGNIELEYDYFINCGGFLNLALYKMTEKLQYNIVNFTSYIRSFYINKNLEFNYDVNNYYRLPEFTLFFILPFVDLNIEEETMVFNLDDRQIDYKELEDIEKLIFEKKDRLLPFEDRYEIEHIKEKIIAYFSIKNKNLYNSETERIRLELTSKFEEMKQETLESIQLLKTQKRSDFEVELNEYRTSRYNLITEELLEYENQKKAENEKMVEELLKIKIGGLNAMCESRREEMFKKIDLNIEEYYHKNMGEIIRKLHEEEDSLRDTKFANIKKLKDEVNTEVSAYMASEKERIDNELTEFKNKSEFTIEKEIRNDVVKKYENLLLDKLKYAEEYAIEKKQALLQEITLETNIFKERTRVNILNEQKQKRDDFVKWLKKYEEEQKGIIVSKLQTFKTKLKEEEEQKCKDYLTKYKNDELLLIHTEFVRHQAELFDTANRNYELKKNEISENLEIYRQEQIELIKKKLLDQEELIVQKLTTEREVSILVNIERYKENLLQEFDDKLKQKEAELQSYQTSEKLKIDIEIITLRNNIIEETNEFRRIELQKQTEELESIYQQHKEQLMIINNQLKENLMLERNEQHKMAKEDLFKELEVQQKIIKDQLILKMENDIELERKNKEIKVSEELEKDILVLREAHEHKKREINSEFEEFKVNLNSSIKKLKEQYDQKFTEDSILLERRRIEYHERKMNELAEDWTLKKKEIDQSSEVYKDEKIKEMEIKSKQTEEEIIQGQLIVREIKILDELEKIRSYKTKELEIEIEDKRKDLENNFNKFKTEMESDILEEKVRLISVTNEYKKSELQKQTLELEILYNQHRDKLLESHSELKQKLHDERIREHEKEKEALLDQLEHEQASKTKALEREHNNFLFTLEDQQRNKKLEQQELIMKELSIFKEKQEEEKRALENELDMFKRQKRNELSNLKQEFEARTKEETDMLIKQRQGFHQTELKRITNETTRKLTDEMETKKKSLLEELKREIDVQKKKEVDTIKDEMRILKDIFKSKIEGEISTVKDKELDKIANEINMMRKEQQEKLDLEIRRNRELADEEIKRNKELADEEIRKRFTSVEDSLSKMFA
jgi:hypothetical protein